MPGCFVFLKISPIKIKVNKTTRSLNIFFCKENKQCYYVSFTIYLAFTFQRQSEPLESESQIHSRGKIITLFVFLTKKVKADGDFIYYKTIMPE